MGAEIIQNISQPQEHTSPEAAQLEGTFAWPAVSQALCALGGRITWQFVLFLWFRLCQLLGEKQVSVAFCFNTAMCALVLELKEMFWLGLSPGCSLLLPV